MKKHLISIFTVAAIAIYLFKKDKTHDTLQYKSNDNPNPMKKIIFLFLLFAIVLSCKNSKNKEEQSVSYKYELEVAADKDLKYPLGDDIEFMFGVLFPYIDKSGREYLTFRSRINNSILFYDLLTGKCLFDVKLEKEGPNDVGRITGYHIEDFDNIYLTSFDKFGLLKIDTSGVIKQFIKYGTTNSGYELRPVFFPESYHYNTLVIHNEKLYITQKPSFASRGKISKTPVSVAIDTVTHSMEELPFRFPPLLTDDEYFSNTMLFGFSFSRDFNGKQLVYSFHMDENIYVTDITSHEERKIPVKSRYINNLNFDKRPDEIELVYKLLLETSCYGNLLYDKYRNVYYRFTQIGVEQRNDTGIAPGILWRSGPAQFSVIILDKDFNIIGETLFTEYTYNPTVAFVHKNGLYISDSHILNPSFDENVLSFKCFTLKESK